jgi:hypothetical protein
MDIIRSPVSRFCNPMTPSQVNHDYFSCLRFGFDSSSFLKSVRERSEHCDYISYLKCFEFYGFLFSWSCVIPFLSLVHQHYFIFICCLSLFSLCCVVFAFLFVVDCFSVNCSPILFLIIVLFFPPGNEVIMTPGHFLYLPQDWIHCIISLNVNYQCNTRSGFVSKYHHHITECGF